MKLKLLSLIILPLLISGCSKDNGNQNYNENIIPIITSKSSGENTLKTFDSASLEDATFTYDGNPHSLEVKNVPEGTSIIYSNNEQTDAGTYEVNATLAKVGYTRRLLTAQMTILKADFEGISFENLTVDYDGKYHSIYVKNLPSFASVTYTNNNKLYAGEYVVTATITANNYNTLVLTATLKIVETLKDITGVTFSDASFKYVGRPHSIYIQSKDSYSVSYTNNAQTEVGSYTVTARISAKGYKTLVLTATLTITGEDFEGIYFNDAIYHYGGPHSITISGKLPYGTTVTYSTEGYGNQTEFINPGVYKISATLTKIGYNKKVLTATLTIFDSENFGGVDTSKTAFKITNTLKYKTLVNELKKGNFTVEEYIVDEYEYPNGTTKTEYSTLKTHYFTSNEYVSSYKNLHDETIDPYPDGYIAKVVGDDVFYKHYDFDGLLEPMNKFPKSAFNDTFSGHYIAYLEGLLDEASNGGFANSQVDGYRINYGSFEIDVNKNEFRVKSKNYYFHEEWTHSEVSILVYKNIGNTKINFPTNLLNYDKEYKTATVGSFRKGLVHYYPTIGNDDKLALTADLTLMQYERDYFSSGTYYLEPEFYGVPVTRLDYNVYVDRFNVDYTGYTLRAYFNNDGYYQGEYSSFPRVNSASYSVSRTYGTYNGDFQFYSDWNN